MTRVMGPVLGLALLGHVVGGTAVAATDNDPATATATDNDPSTSLRLEYGTTLALAGDLERAEGVFSALLSPGPEAAAAWCNLGNLHLMRGEAEVACDLYDRALELEPGACGTLLNRAVARMVLADVAGSRADAARAMSDCGGLDEALALLGIESIGTQRPADEMDHAPSLSEEDVRALLVAALSHVPTDSLGESSAEGTSSEEKDSAPQSVWRPAGTRAAGGTELARILHWQY